MISKRTYKQIERLFTDENKDVIIKKIQSMALGWMPEAGAGDIAIESLLTGDLLSGPNALSNKYKTYQSQHIETYKKYNGRADFGNVQLRAIADVRASFIAGEGISIISGTENSQFEDWAEAFLEFNNLNGINLFKSVLGGELSGQVVFDVRATDKYKYEIKGSDTLFIKLLRVPLVPNKEIKFDLSDPLDFTSASNFTKRGAKDGKSFREKIYLSNPLVLTLGGDDALSEGPTTKVGMLLNDFENYDRALKDIRKLNHITARVTPYFKTDSKKDADSISQKINGTKWQIGEAFVGNAEFSYVGPTTGAHTNLETELKSTVKNISSISGVPVHWIGYVDMMSNRSTAETLYESINNATISDRVSWAAFIKDMLIRAQILYIDKGGKAINKVYTDFEVKIPLINFSKMAETINALSTAFHDDAISMADYRSNLPGINPTATKKAIEKEKEEKSGEDYNNFMNNFNNDQSTTNQDNADNSSVNNMEEQNG